jgi:hypothetical protein
MPGDLRAAFWQQHNPDPNPIPNTKPNVGHIFATDATARVGVRRQGRFEPKTPSLPSLICRLSVITTSIGRYRGIRIVKAFGVMRRLTQQCHHTQRTNT